MQNKISLRSCLSPLCTWNPVLSWWKGYIVSFRPVLFLMQMYTTIPARHLSKLMRPKQIKVVGSSYLRSMRISPWILITTSNSHIHHLSRQTPAICLVLPVRWLSDNCKVPARCPTRHLSTPDRHLSDKYHTYTRHIPYAHQTYTYVGSWQMSGGASGRHLAIVWQSSHWSQIWQTHYFYLLWSHYLRKPAFPWLQFCNCSYIGTISSSAIKSDFKIRFLSSLKMKWVMKWNVRKTWICLFWKEVTWECFKQMKWSFYQGTFLQFSLFRCIIFHYFMIATETFLFCHGFNTHCTGS